MSDNTLYRKLLGKTKTEALRDLVRSHLQENPCAECGEDDWRCLQFDHIDPSRKAFNIADALSNPYRRSLLRVALEISKCRVLCGSCHMRWTSKQRQWWRASD